MFNKNKYRACVIGAGKTSAEIASQLGISEATYYRKISNNGAFNRAEIQRLIEILNIENPMEIFFAA